MSVIDGGAKDGSAQLFHCHTKEGTGPNPGGRSRTPRSPPATTSSAARCAPNCSHTTSRSRQTTGPATTSTAGGYTSNTSPNNARCPSSPPRPAPQTARSHDSSRNTPSRPAAAAHPATTKPHRRQRLPRTARQRRPTPRRNRTRPTLPGLRPHPLPQRRRHTPPRAPRHAHQAARHTRDRVRRRPARTPHARPTPPATHHARPDPPPPSRRAPRPTPRRAPRPPRTARLRPACALGREDPRDRHRRRGIPHAQRRRRHGSSLLRTIRNAETAIGEPVLTEHGRTAPLRLTPTGRRLLQQASSTASHTVEPDVRLDRPNVPQ